MASASCACRDCFDIASPEDVDTPALCGECEEAECQPMSSDYTNGTANWQNECQREDTYSV